MFAALPLVLCFGYRHLIVAHERSADFGNLVWDRTGEEINHQWGKSLAAERLLSRYVAGELVSSVGYWSLLKPIWNRFQQVESIRFSGGERPQKMCNSCFEKFKGFADREVRCRVPDAHS